MPDVKTPVLDNRMGPVFAGPSFYPKRAHHFKLLGIGFSQTYIPAFTVTIDHSVRKDDRSFAPDLPCRVLDFSGFPVQTKEIGNSIFGFRDIFLLI